MVEVNASELAKQIDQTERDIQFTKKLLHEIVKSHVELTGTDLEFFEEITKTKNKLDDTIKTLKKTHAEAVELSELKKLFTQLTEEIIVIKDWLAEAPDEDFRKALEATRKVITKHLDDAAKKFEKYKHLIPPQK